MSGAAVYCARCQKEMDPSEVAEKGESYCLDCLLTVTDKSLAEAAQDTSVSAPPSNARRNVLVLVALGSLIWTVKSFPVLRDSFTPLTPISRGAVPADPKSQACIVLLWRAVRRLQDGGDLTGFPYCPAGNKAYSVVKEGNDEVVRCPNPEAHGVAEISVSKRHPVPRATR